DGGVLYSAGGNGKIHVWGVGTRALLKSLQRHEGKTWAVAASPDGKLLASGGDDKTGKGWSVQGGDNITSLSGLGTTALPDEATGPAAEAEAQVKSRGWLTATILSFALLLLAALLLGLWMWRRRRGETEQAPDPVEEKPAGVISFPCASCGKVLKAKA